MKEQLIIDRTTVYEVDMECLEKKQDHVPAGENSGVPLCPETKERTGPLEPVLFCTAD